MGWLSIFNKALGARIYTVGAIFASVIAVFDWIKNHLLGGGMAEWIGIPSPVAAIIFILLWFLFFTAKYAHKLRIQIEEARTEIAKLRAEGVVIRNDGMTPFNDQHGLRTWGERVNSWREKTINALSKISVADSIWFSTLDTLPELPRAGNPNNVKDAKHLKLLREHDRRLDILGQMIRDEWGFRNTRS